jgi:hypothetical protein
MNTAQFKYEQAPKQEEGVYDVSITVGTFTYNDRLNIWRALDALLAMCKERDVNQVVLILQDEELPRTFSETFMEELQTEEGRHQLGLMLDRRARPLFYAGEDTLMQSFGESIYIPIRYRGLFIDPLMGTPTNLGMHGSKLFIKSASLPSKDWVPVKRLLMQCIEVSVEALLQQDVTMYHLALPWNNSPYISKDALRQKLEAFRSDKQKIEETK